MANAKISQIGSTATSIADADLIEIEQGGTSKQAAAGLIRGLRLVEAHTAVSGDATMNFTTGITSAYDDYLLELINFIPLTTTVNLLMRVGTGGGPSYDSGSNYTYANFQVDSTGGSGARAGAAQTSFELVNALVTTTTIGYSGSIKCFAPANAAVQPYFTHQGCRTITGTTMLSNFGGFNYLSTTAITALQVLFSSGNIGAGIGRLYALAKA